MERTPLSPLRAYAESGSAPPEKVYFFLALDAEMWYKYCCLRKSFAHREGPVGKFSFPMGPFLMHN